MAALRIHQHGIDDVRVALPLPPLAFRAARQIGRVAALQHHALDRLGILAGTGACGIGARGVSASQLSKAITGEKSILGSPSLRRKPRARAALGETAAPRKSSSPSPSRS